MPRKKNTIESTSVHRTPAAMIGETEVTVALVGCGGNGSMMLTRLARLDYALRACGRPGLRVYAYDPDDVSPTNVGRQAFSPADVGLSKANVSVHRINAWYGTDWSAGQSIYPGTIPSFLGSGSTTQPDILITCVDTAKARREIAKFMGSGYSGPRYWLDLGNERIDGQVILGQPVESLFNERVNECVRLPVVTEMFPDILDSKKRESNAPTCSVAEALDRQSLFVNDVLTTWAAQILDDLLRIGELRWHGAFVNLASGRVNPIPIPVPKPIAREVAV